MQSPTDPPPFIVSQRLWRLICPPAEQKKCLRPESLWTLPRDEDQAGIRPIDIAGLPPGACRWELINGGKTAGKTAALERRDFLADLQREENKRLCVTIEAGIGKTTTLRQCDYVRQAADPASLSIFVEFAELPASANMFLGTCDQHADDPERTPLLIRKLQNAPRLKDFRGSQLRALIERSIRRGRFSLIVDSLDQSAGMDNARESCRALRDFLQRYPEVCCVVSGRPFAVRRYWDSLFEPQGSWQFVKVDVFTREESERYVGSQRLARLTQLDADVIAIPRSLEMVRRISDADLSGLRTKSDVYYRSLAGLRGQAAEVRLSEAASWKLFSLLAFEMLRCGYRANLAGIEAGERKDEFLDGMWERQGEMLRKRLTVGSTDELDKKLGRLLAMNENLADPVLAGTEDPETVHFFWRNQTLMDMFAALWITRYAVDDGDFAWFHQQLGEEASRELCQLAVEMPLTKDVRGVRSADVNRRDVQAFSVILADGVNAEGDSKTRWTEWIYRSWPNLLELAGYLREWSGSDEDLAAATFAAQEDAWKRVEAGQDLADANAAQELLLRFLGEFPGIHRGDRGPESQRVAVEMCAWRAPFDNDVKDSFKTGFREIPAGWLRKHLFGGKREIRFSRLELAITPVTNEQYELFDPQHKRHRRCASVWHDSPSRLFHESETRATLPPRGFRRRAASRRSLPPAMRLTYAAQS